MSDHHHDHGHGHDHGPTDSAQVPWAGRDLSPSGFEADTGAADPALLAALATPGDDLALMRAVEASRFVVPIVADLTEADTTGDLAVEKQVDMAAVTLVAPDGQRALPVFTGTDALAAWDPAARPVPVTPARAGQAAVAEGCDVIVVDVAGPTHARAAALDGLGAGPAAPLGAAAHRPLRRPQRRRRPARRGRRHGPRARGGHPAGEGVLGVVLDLRPGLTPEQVRAVATRVGERLATDGELRARIDGLAFRLR